MTRGGEIRCKPLALPQDVEVIRHLTRSQRRRVWTVQMFLIFALRHPDVLPPATWAYGQRRPSEGLRAGRSCADPTRWKDSRGLASVLFGSELVFVAQPR